MSGALHERWQVGDDIWSPREACPPTGAMALRHHEPQVARLPRLPSRRWLREALRMGDAQQAARAARPLLEFIAAQERLVRAPSRTRRRTLADRQRDDRLWLDTETYVAWTIDGELVAVLERDPAQSRWSPLITPLSDGQRRVLFSFDRLIPTVIALYRGDDLSRGPITRFFPHFDLAAAHRAARAREEEAIAEAARAAATAKAPAIRRPIAHRLKKSRFHPEGNFVLLAPPSPDSGLPEFAVIQPLAPPRRAFETKRQAERAAARMLRLGHTSTRFVPARVIGAVEVRPRFRPGIDLPRDPERRLELLRREPRIALPELDAAWLPRFVHDQTGEWAPQRFRNHRTIRTKLNEQLVRELGDASGSLTGAFATADLRRRLGQDEPDLVPEFEAAARVALRAQRRLPSTWLDMLGMEREMLAPDWRDLAGRRHEPPREETSHWLRAPVEFGRPHPDGLRSRIVELRIDDLPGLIELAGWKPVLWLVKLSLSAEPAWILPIPSPT